MIKKISILFLVVCLASSVSLAQTSTETLKDGVLNVTSEAKDGSKSVLNLPTKKDGSIDRDAMMKKMFQADGDLAEGSTSGTYNVGVVTKIPGKGEKGGTKYYNNVTDVKTFKNGVISESSGGSEVFSGKVEFKTSDGKKMSLTGMVTLEKVK